MNFYIKTFGCQMNVNDSEKMSHLLTSGGMNASVDEDGADVVIVNSCAVREKAQDKIFSYIGRLPADKVVVVAGCVAQAEREEIIKRNSRVRFVLGTHQYYQIKDLLSGSIGDVPRSAFTEFSKDWQDVCPDAGSRQSPVTAYISIMEGCDNFCSYCIVPFTRGREKYRPFRSIIEEARGLAGDGYREIILLGQNVNNWRDDRQQLRFADLLRSLTREVDIPWIRFITSYPGYFEDELIDVMAEYPRIARHMHFPAQSGSTRILKKMNRTYTRRDYLGILRRIRRRIPGFKFSSDFIVGFPTESDHDFELTLSLLEMVGFESVFSFIYSPRKYTRALPLGDPVDPVLKKERLHRLQKLQGEIQLRNNRKLIGREVKVLVVEPHPKQAGEMIGRTESYRVVNFPSAAPPGDFRKVRIGSVGPHSLRGTEIA